MSYLVTSEDDDGVWWDEPNMFNTRQEAIAYASGRKLPSGYQHCIYRCDFLEALGASEAQTTAMETKR